MPIASPRRCEPDQVPRVYSQPHCPRASRLPPRPLGEGPGKAPLAIVEHLRRSRGDDKERPNPLHESQVEKKSDFLSRTVKTVPIVLNSESLPGIVFQWALRGKVRFL